VKVVWTPQANRDRVNIFDYIEQDSPRAAVANDDRILQSIEFIRNFAKIGRKGRIPGTREFVVPDSPYVLLYKIEDTTLVMFRIMHGAQRWPRKTPKL
jgi:addiction module RelE/StbE family toxin